MSLREFLNRLASPLRKSRSENHLDDEIRNHLDLAAEQYRRAGMDPEQARLAARRDFGGVEQIKEDYRDQRSFPLVESIAQDIRFGLRSTARFPMFTLVGVLTLALGIGATTAVFSVIDRLMFRSLPYLEEDRLVSVGMTAPIEPNEFMLGADYLEWRDHQTPFVSMTTWSTTGDCDITDQSPLRVTCALVEASFLPTFGVQPFAGRNFTVEEDRPNAPRVVLVSYGLWQSRFARRSDVVGQTLVLDGAPAKVIGVLPADFELPNMGHPDLLVPQAMDEASQRRPNQGPGDILRGFARLKPGVTVEQAHDALQPLFQDSLEFVPAQFRKEVRLQVRSLRDRQIQDARLAAWILFGSVIAVLLIACANIANLLLARAAHRRRELAVRAALGAGRARLIRQALTESLLLASMGGFAGLLLAYGLLRWFVALAPQGIPRLSEAQLDPRVLLFTIAASLLCGVLFGLAPALHRPRAEDLAGARAVGASSLLGRHMLVGAQVAVSVVLLAGAGLLMRSLWNLQNVATGMQTENVLAATILLGQQLYREPAQRLTFFEELERRLRRVPGVTALAISDTLPPSGRTNATIYSRIEVEGREPAEEGTGGMVVWRAVTPEYFSALGIKVRGRVFTEQDREPQQRAAVISDSLARRLFPNEDALGKQFRFNMQPTWHTVIGIADDVKNAGLTRASDPEFYIVRHHAPGPLTPAETSRQASILLRAKANANVVAEWTRAEIAALDATLPITIEPIQQRVSELNQRPRFNATLLALFATTGMLLAAIGLYGVMAFLVTERTREIGVRMALGATPKEVARLILTHAARWSIGGALLGVAATLAATQYVKSLLYGVSEHDPITIATAATILITVALIAAYLPARRAANLDPMRALRLD